jgi:hypothetical protein
LINSTTHDEYLFHGKNIIHLLMHRYDKVHWYMGRIAGSLGYVNIGFGIALYGAFGKDIAALGIAFIVWSACLILSFLFAGIRIGQTHDEPKKPSLGGVYAYGRPRTLATPVGNPTHRFLV